MPKSCPFCRGSNNNCFHCNNEQTRVAGSVPMDTVDITGKPAITEAMFKNLATPTKRVKKILRCRSKELNIVKSNYSLILPSQSSVTRVIVDSKIEKYKSDPTMIPVIDVIYVGGRLVLNGDGHHSFVAAMKIGFHMQLHLITFGLRHLIHEDWNRVKWEGFKENPAAQKGTTMVSLDSSYIIS